MLVLVIWCEWVVVYNQSCTHKVINQEVLLTLPTIATWKKNYVHYQILKLKELCIM